MTRWLSAVSLVLTGLVITSVAEARWYDPSIGRFISADPVPNDHGLRDYVFANNNPVTFVDPNGNSPLQWWLGSGKVCMPKNCSKC